MSLSLLTLWALSSASSHPAEEEEDWEQLCGAWLPPMLTTTAANAMHIHTAVWKRYEVFKNVSKSKEKDGTAALASLYADILQVNYNRYPESACVYIHMFRKFSVIRFWILRFFLKVSVDSECHSFQASVIFPCAHF